jgi:hypothetical protein
MYSAQSLPRRCSEHQKLVNEEINAWEAYDGLKESLKNDWSSEVHGDFGLDGRHLVDNSAG